MKSKMVEFVHSIMSYTHYALLIIAFILLVIYFINRRYTEIQKGIRRYNRRSKRLAKKDKSNYPYVLIMVDMQVEFDSSRDDELKKNVTRLLKNAMHDRAYIVISNYMRFGKIHEDLSGLIRRYPHKAWCTADRSDKSDAVQTKLVSNKVRPGHFKICGVNLCMCVYDTVEHLADMYPKHKIIVYGTACNCACQTDSGYSKCPRTIEEMHKKRNIEYLD